MHLTLTTDDPKPSYGRRLSREWRTLLLGLLLCCLALIWLMTAALFHARSRSIEEHAQNMAQAQLNLASIQFEQQFTLLRTALQQRALEREASALPAPIDNLDELWLIPPQGAPRALSGSSNRPPLHIQALARRLVSDPADGAPFVLLPPPLQFSVSKRIPFLLPACNRSGVCRASYYGSFNASDWLPALLRDTPGSQIRLFNRAGQLLIQSTPAPTQTLSTWRRLAQWLTLLPSPHMEASAVVPSIPLRITVAVSTRGTWSTDRSLPLLLLGSTLLSALLAFFGIVGNRLHHQARRERRQLDEHTALLALSNANLKKKLHKLASTHQDLQALLDTIQVGVLILHPDRHEVTTANMAAGRLFGLHISELIGRSILSLLADPADVEGCESLLDQGLGISDREIQLRDGGGKIFWSQVSMRRVRFNDHHSIVMSVVDISERMSHNQQLQREKQETERLVKQLQEMQHELYERATHDDLTGVANRPHFLQQAQQAYRQALRQGTPLGLAIIDLDMFKLVNDTYGHDAGDLVLQQVAMACESCLDEGQQLGRLGGEEFAILMPHCDYAQAIELAEQVKRKIAELIISYHDDRIRVTLSIGVSCWSPQDRPLLIGRLFKLADLALYQAKETGRNRVVPARALNCLEP
ncbi:sensor domain-containing diguanylate cyclase [Pseudogulbenkiania ferrooxidans]|uniref:diguanylate cyclase n=1 Tax=Pseudogulbenkiania ferrooxidans 2002 TaxID=279714 RepID=B9Z1G6_9NEIS|nr:sensor domain-containing diguanylate cyclase [Pseudogulbenkiania ferrooxidans]EEG09261.1 diguanylate cyclase with PAS/PAC sensor [Pseudogulbenkiania ferrooxidans 2002]